MQLDRGSAELLFRLICSRYETGSIILPAINFSMDPYFRLVTSHLIEYSEDWSSGNAYINPANIALVQEEREIAA